jgi:hypothetical protein
MYKRRMTTGKIDKVSRPGQLTTLEQRRTSGSEIGATARTDLRRFLF